MALSARERWERANRRKTPIPDGGGVVCALCGYEAHTLGRHLRARHGIASREYTARTGQPVVGEHHRAIQADLYRDRHGGPYWTRERIIAAMRAHAKQTGKAPTARLWDRSRTTRAGNQVGRFRTRPSTATVARVFGSFSAAREAAGLQMRRREPSPRCRRGHLKDYPGARCKVCDREADARQRRAAGIPPRGQKPILPCVNCGKTDGPRSHGRCQVCDNYTRRRGVERPLSPCACGCGAWAAVGSEYAHGHMPVEVKRALNRAYTARSKARKSRRS